MDTIYRLIDTILPFEPLSYDFMKNALIAILIITPMFGLIGTLVVNNELAFFSDTLGHSALAGIGIGALLGIGDPTVSMVIFGVFFSILLVLVKGRGKVGTNTAIGAFSSTAMALGIVLLSSGGGFSKYTIYLIGDFLSVNTHQIGLSLIVLAGVLVFWVTLSNKLYLLGVNTGLARSYGIRAQLYDAAFICVVAIVVMVAIEWVGVMIISSMLVLPAAAARNLTTRIRSYTAVSVLTALLGGIAGLITSFYSGASTGATIVLFLAVFYFSSLFFVKK